MAAIVTWDPALSTGPDHVWGEVQLGQAMWRLRWAQQDANLFLLTFTHPCCGQFSSCDTRDRFFIGSRGKAHRDTGSGYVVHCGMACDAPRTFAADKNFNTNFTPTRHEPALLKWWMEEAWGLSVLESELAYADLTMIDWQAEDERARAAAARTSQTR